MSKCNGPTCGAEIIWLKTKEGKSIPVDDGELAAAYAAEGIAFDAKDPQLSPHWATCPDSGTFRKRKR